MAPPNLRGRRVTRQAAPGNYEASDRAVMGLRPTDGDESHCHPERSERAQNDRLSRRAERRNGRTTAGTEPSEKNAEHFLRELCGLCVEVLKWVAALLHCKLMGVEIQVRTGGASCGASGRRIESDKGMRSCCPKALAGGMLEAQIFQSRTQGIKCIPWQPLSRFPGNLSLQLWRGAAVRGVTG